jgi:hypothetical protein
MVESPPAVEPAPDDSAAPPRGLVARYWWVVGLAIAAAVVVVAAFLTSRDPDGLQRVAGDQGFAGSAQQAPFEIIPGYSIPGVDADVARIVAGIIGIAVVFAVVLVVGRVLARRRA